ncbi:hypothetical protein XELAEV_18032196mg [Xenopus laevis]|uniref:Uncharacterized protein n=1 Tax=Xenopus laevis TaxID=8355 RepID=A0A974GY05_XENLA|nr:hypothetical protein XELAEV_18004664mg [Xenopus laevis]OCT76993.1 hypothetical protein XELAEV_18032196mg [Xenopus laevis]
MNPMHFPSFLLYSVSEELSIGSGLAHDRVTTNQSGHGREYVTASANPRNPGRELATLIAAAIATGGGVGFRL